MNYLEPKAHIIIEKDGKILFLKRENTGCYDGYWCLPTGRVDKGENPTEAAAREVREEVGVKITPAHVSTVYAKVPNAFDASKEDFIDLCFFFSALTFEGQVENMEPEKHSEMKWFSKDDLPELLMPVCKYGLECYENNISYKEFGFGINSLVN